MNLVDYILIILIVIVLIFAIRKSIKDHRQGKDCTGNCSNCNQNCHK